MADDNFFSQYDSLRSPTNQQPVDTVEHGGRPVITVPRRATDEGNFFEQFEPLREKNYTSAKSSGGGIARQLPAGFNEGLADVAGAPVDLAKAGLQGLGAVENKIVTGLGGQPLTDPYAGVNPIGGSESIKSALGVIGADPRATPAQTGPERIARGVGGGVAAMVGPEAILGVLGKVGALTPEIAAKVAQYFGASSSSADVAASAGIGGLSGGTGEAAAEVAPEPLKPAARALGTLGGAGLGAAGVAGARGVPANEIKAGKDFIAPMTEGGREAIAGQTLEKAAENPTAVRQSLANQPADLVPGSKPTTFQVTGDMGLGALEREQQTQHPAGKFS